MMHYILSGIELHSDDGFGITADAYYKSAEHLMNNHFEHYDVTQQAEMPQNFLYRHSIELYLKSLIIIFHRKLQINYGTVPFDSKEPEVYIDGKWKKLYTCHYIDKLYDYWLNSLLKPYNAQLYEMAPDGDWKEYQKINELMEIICKYDRDSAYFRYPITKNNGLDPEKYTMQKFDPAVFLDKTPTPRRKFDKGKVMMLLVDDKDNIVNAFEHKENILSDVRDGLKEIAFYFHCVHIMTRVTLCGGM